LARFQGNINTSSDRAAATVLFLVLMVVVLLAVWWIANPTSFAAAAQHLGIDVMSPGATATPVP
jgi:hypothetical protein